jgi:hypothetical protein
MKASSQFSPEALGLGPVEIEEVEVSKTADDILRVKRQLKLRTLLEFLQSAADENPEILELPVFTVEFGGLEKAIQIEIASEAGQIIISS